MRLESVKKNQELTPDDISSNVHQEAEWFSTELLGNATIGRDQYRPIKRVWAQLALYLKKILPNI